MVEACRYGSSSLALLLRLCKGANIRSGCGHNGLVVKGHGPGKTCFTVDSTCTLVTLYGQHFFKCRKFQPSYGTKSFDRQLGFYCTNGCVLFVKCCLASFSVILVSVGSSLVTFYLGDVHVVQRSLCTTKYLQDHSLIYFTVLVMEALPGLW